jgi:predicted N-acetyltransferase YhbS
VQCVPDPRRAQLRFVIVDPAWHGHGAGRALLEAALAWCRERGVETCFLWTVEGLPVSRAMYERAGFCVVERVEDARYTVPRVSLRMELVLGSAAGLCGVAVQECTSRGGDVRQDDQTAPHSAWPRQLLLDSSADRRRSR